MPVWFESYWRFNPNRKLAPWEVKQRARDAATKAARAKARKLGSTIV